MEGFFSQKETAAASVVRSIKGCGACKLKDQCKSPKLPATGIGSNGIMLLVESPNAVEDKTHGEESGDRMLKRLLGRHGVKITACRKVYAVRCRPADDKSPTDEEIDYCRPDVWKEIREMKPRVIIALGIGAMKSLLSHRTEKGLGEIAKWRGWEIPDRETKCWVVPTMTSQDVATGMSKNRAYETVFEQDLVTAIKVREKPYPTYQEESELVEIVDNERDVVRLLRDFCKMELGEFTFDYETSGLKPYANGHFIASCAIKESSGKMAYSWMWPKDPDSAVCRWWKKLMLGPGYKIAQNMKFEDLWTNVILEHGINNWHHDTMLVSHVLDNRPSVTGLKFQSYIKFGLLDYESEVMPFLKSSEADEKLCGANAFNTIHKAPRRPLLLYGGIDALVEDMLYQIQIPLIKELADAPKHL